MRSPGIHGLWEAGLRDASACKSFETLGHEIFELVSPRAFAFYFRGWEQRAKCKVFMEVWCGRLMVLWGGRAFVKFRVCVHRIVSNVTGISDQKGN